MKDDIIYRQQAIDAVCDACSDWCDEGVCKKVSAIQKVPSAQPECPEWVRKVELMHSKALEMPYIKKPMAWSLYQVWKEYDNE